MNELIFTTEKEAMIINYGQAKLFE